MHHAFLSLNGASWSDQISGTTSGHQTYRKSLFRIWEITQPVNVCKYKIQNKIKLIESQKNIRGENQEKTKKNRKTQEKKAKEESRKTNKNQEKLTESNVKNLTIQLNKKKILHTEDKASLD